jgi:hypothetical protein
MVEGRSPQYTNRNSSRLPGSGRDPFLLKRLNFHAAPQEDNGLRT